MLLSQYYLPQTELEESTKDAFYDCLQTIISKLPDKEVVISWGDWNGLIVKEAVGYEGVHGGYGYGERNADRDRVLVFAGTSDFVIGYTFIDFILLRKRNLKMIKNIKVIPSQECVPQHKLLTCELQLKTPFSSKLCYWKLKEQTVQKEIERVLSAKLNAFNTVAASMEQIWNMLKAVLLDTTNETCAKTKKCYHKRVTWWWNDEVNLAFVEKRWCW